MYYKHFKGGIYEFIGYAKDANSLNDLVVYRSCSTDDLWVRDKADFFSDAGDDLPRFKLLVS